MVANWEEVMSKADLWGGLGLLAFGLALIFLIIPMGTVSGAYFGLAPTVFPTIMASGLTLCALGLVIQSVKRLRVGHHGAEIPVNQWNLLMFLIAAALILGGVVIIDVAGILVGGPLMIAGLMVFLGERHPIRIATTAIVPVVALWVLALYVFHTPLP